MRRADALEVSTPSDTEIVLRRTFDASRHLVFAALTTPELLRRWYGARGWELVVCEIDLRVGGSWRFVSRGPNGQQMGQQGTYREVNRPARLVYSEVFDNQSYEGEALIIQDLCEHDDATTLVSVVRYASRQARDTVLRYPMARGVRESYEALDHLLAELTCHR